jgi:glycosyltransferase involved in cell wall biosynthesis
MILVDVIMPAYNHEKYIAQAIESVLMQQCDFEYRLIIGEDCSTDRTKTICMEFQNKYPNRILLLNSCANEGMAANYKRLFKTSTAEYVAILEGDDYWIDNKKLKKQIEILMQNPEIGLVHTNYYALYENRLQKTGNTFAYPDQFRGNLVKESDVRIKCIINPLTTCFRSKLVKENVDFDFIVNNNLLTVDIFLWAEICRRSKVEYLNDLTGVYRIHSNSITGNRNIEAIEKFHHTSTLMVNYLMDKYNISNTIKEQYNSSSSLQLIYQYILAKQPVKAKSKLSEVHIVGSYFDSFIYYSAKYKYLYFLCPLYCKFMSIMSCMKQKLYKFSN